jgi:steroid 5-alpha reductase family enzyme
MRLAIFLTVRNQRLGEDERYTEMKQRWKNHLLLKAYIKVFALQATAMMVIAFPIFFISRHFVIKSFFDLLWYQQLGFLLWMFGFIFESVADFQKSQFKKKTQGSYQLCQSGLWAYSQYAQYFGELCVWWGIYLYSCTGFWHSSGHLAILGPLLLTIVIIKISGIPPIEKKRHQHWGNNPAYLDYKKRVPLLIPILPLLFKSKKKYADHHIKPEVR